MKFKINQIYNYNGIALKITGRTNKFVEWQIIQHLGRFNEKVTEEGKSIIRNWNGREVLIIKDNTIEAS